MQRTFCDNCGQPASSLPKSAFVDGIGARGFSIEPCWRGVGGVKADICENCCEVLLHQAANKMEEVREALERSRKGIAALEGAVTK